MERYETLVDQPGGRDLYVAWFTELDPVRRRGGEPSGELVDRVLDAAESDSRLERLTRVLKDAEAASLYRGEIDTDDQVTLQQIDERLEAAEGIVRRRSVAEEQGRHLGSADPTSDAKSVLVKYLWKVERAADAVEAALPTTQPNRDRRDYRVPAACNETLDHVDDAASEMFVKDVVDEMRERYDDNERRESEARHLADATEIKHARAMRLWTASRVPSSRPPRDSAEASVRKEHRSAVREAFEVACYGVGGRGKPDALALGPDERARLARYLAEERFPRTTPYASNPSHRPLAVSDRTFDTAEAAAGTRRVAETIAGIRSRHGYTAWERAESERTYNREKHTSPEEAPNVVIEVVEGAWREVDRLRSQDARRELDWRDLVHGSRETPRTAQPPTHADRVGPAQADRSGPEDVPDGSDVGGRWG